MTSNPPPHNIYHLLTHSEWAAFQRSAIYEPPSVASEGFIHCSPAERVTEVARAFYSGRTDLVLLEIDPTRLDSRLVVEPAVDRPGMFPHIYGPLNLGAVVSAQDYPLDDTGNRSTATSG
jgi:uncharacterized protein (DUF952 family)